ncbi:hypothetical protein ACFE04_024737 [Oxalis oulophora]
MEGTTANAEQDWFYIEIYFLIQSNRVYSNSSAGQSLALCLVTENIKGLVLDLHRLGESSYTCDQQPMDLASSDSFTLSRKINLCTESFRKMQKLQILQLYGVNFTGDYAYIPKNLVLLGWHGFPLRCIPSNFRFEKLVSLDLSYSEIETVGTLIMPKLIYLNLSYCQRLTKMTNFAKIPHVKRLIFRGCLGSLRTLNLSGNPFHNLAESISSHTSLEVLILDNCTGIQSLQNLPIKLKSLWVTNCSSLERIESPEVSSRLQITHVVADQCDKLVGLGNLYNIYSINHIDKAIIKSLGFSNLESTSNIKVDMINTLTSTRKMTSLEVLHQYGIQNIFLPENDLPNSFSFEGEGSKLYFKVLPVAGTKISGLNVCITYAVLQDAQQINLSKKPFFFHIDIPARHKRWWYIPICYAVPKDKKNMIWVSHWKVGDGLEVGDEVLICVHPIDSFQIKKCGISLFHVADLKSATEVIGDSAQEPAPLDSNGFDERYYTLHEAQRVPIDNY